MPEKKTASSPRSIKTVMKMRQVSAPGTNAVPRVAEKILTTATVNNQNILGTGIYTIIENVKKIKSVPCSSQGVYTGELYSYN